MRWMPSPVTSCGNSIWCRRRRAMRRADRGPRVPRRTWTSYSLAPAKGLLYVPAGNPAPDFAGGSREGENLFASSIVVLDAKTGAYKKHFQLVKRDFHDWDISSAPLL